jgi:hypothetical protein
MMIVLERNFKFITTTDDMIEAVLFCGKTLLLEAKVPTNGNFWAVAIYIVTVSYTGEIKNVDQHL